MTQVERAKGQSIQEARRVLKSNPEARLFRLTCICGWETRENPGHVAARIGRHFDYWDAEPWEKVTVAPAQRGGSR